MNFGKWRKPRGGRKRKKGSPENLASDADVLEAKFHEPARIGELPA